MREWTDKRFDKYFDGLWLGLVYISDYVYKYIIFYIIPYEQGHYLYSNHDQARKMHWHSGISVDPGWF